MPDRSESLAEEAGIRASMPKPAPRGNHCGRCFGWTPGATCRFCGHPTDPSGKNARPYLTSSSPRPAPDPKIAYAALAKAITGYKRAARRRAYSMTEADRRAADDAVEAANDLLLLAQVDVERAIGVRT